MLQQKNQALMNALDKAHTDLFKAQEIASDLKKQLESKKHSEQLSGWAIDRAIEAAKVMTDKPKSVKDVIGVAQEILDGVDQLAGEKP